MNVRRTIVALAASAVAVVALGLFSGLAVHAAGPGGGGMGGPGGAGGPGGRGGGGFGRGGGRNAAPVDTSPRTLSPYFVPAQPGAKAPDPDGFIQRWLLLEPFVNNLRSNTGFNDTFVRGAISAHQFPEQFMTLAKDGDKVTLGTQELAWHALDSTNFNVKLYRFAYGLNKTVYGVLFFAETVVNSPREMPNVHLAVGSNSASIWWVNGKEAVDLFGDRRMVMDDCVSRRLTLKQGANVIHGAVINGPGMSDFCARFIDDDGNPVKDITISLEKGN